MVFKRWQIVAGIALLVTSSVASALSLGRVRGTALLGRSLDLSIQSTMEPNEALPEASCLSAEVFYGDTRVSPNAVSVTPERVSTGEMRLRLRASTIVDEPVVTLFVRSTCAGASSRRYVLLAEALSEADTASVVTIAPTPAATPRVPATPLNSPRIAFGGATPQVDQAASGPAPLASGSTNRANSIAANRRAERAEQRQKQRNARSASRPTPSDASEAVARAPRASSASVMRKAESAKTASPRLQVDLLDLTTANLGLRGSAELASAPSSDEAVRRQAQALWRALNASPEEAMRESLRLEGIDAQMRVAQEQNKRQAQDIAKLSTDLAAAQDARYVNPLTIGLGLLALAALALSFVFWQRSRNAEGSESDAKPWWRGNSSKNRPQDEQHLWNHLGDGSGSLMQGLEKSPSSVFAASGNAPNNASLDALNALDTPGAISRMRQMPASSGAQQAMRYPTDAKEPRSIQPMAKKSASMAEQGSQKSGAIGVGRSGSGQVDSTPPAPFTGGPAIQAARGGRNGFGNTDFAASGYNVPRVVAAEELFDIQEQADFFLSLGQPDQAIEVLKNHITDNVETSALAYMDLFDIYHRTGRKAEYFELREEFNRVFNAQVPDFTQYGARSNGLEDFPHVLEPIEAAWSRPHQAQDVIEESIFRQPEQDQTLDMAAYRELMLLYALAKELTRPDAAYSMLPISTQIPVLPNADDETSKPDLDLGDDLLLSLPTDDLLSPDDRTVSLPYGLVKPSANQANDDGSLDFDLSDSAALLPAKKPGFKK